MVVKVPRLSEHLLSFCVSARAERRSVGDYVRYCLKALLRCITDEEVRLQVSHALSSKELAVQRDVEMRLSAADGILGLEHLLAHGCDMSLPKDGRQMAALVTQQLQKLFEY